MIIAIANIIGKPNNFRTDKLVPINIIPPVISGDALVGNTLSSTTGTWFSDTGVIGFIYQWTRDGIDIIGANNNTYTLVSEDFTRAITCKVKATDLDGTSNFVSSNALVEKTAINFEARVITDGGTFEAQSCLITFIQELS